MQIQTEDSERLAQLAAKLAQVCAKATEARAELVKAERRVDRADEALAAVCEEYDHERLRLWGANPDVAALLASEGSMALYRARRWPKSTALVGE